MGFRYFVLLQTGHISSSSLINEAARKRKRENDKVYILNNMIYNSSSFGQIDYFRGQPHRTALMSQQRLNVVTSGLNQKLASYKMGKL